jgi:hypothetical protein
MLKPDGVDATSGFFQPLAEWRSVRVQAGGEPTPGGVADRSRRERGWSRRVPSPSPRRVSPPSRAPSSGGVRCAGLLDRLSLSGWACGILFVHRQYRTTRSNGFSRWSRSRWPGGCGRMGHVEPGTVAGARAEGGRMISLALAAVVILAACAAAFVLWRTGPPSPRAGGRRPPGSSNDGMGAILPSVADAHHHDGGSHGDGGGHGGSDGGGSGGGDGGGGGH